MRPGMYTFRLCFDKWVPPALHVTCFWIWVQLCRGHSADFLAVQGGAPQEHNYHGPALHYKLGTVPQDRRLGRQSQSQAQH